MEKEIFEIDYSRFYWQNELVRLRAVNADDWRQSYLNQYDSRARLFLECEVELPPTEAGERDGLMKYADCEEFHGRTMFTIETLDGRGVGGLNINSIDERNGTFSVAMQLSPDMRGKGYGTAAMRIILGYAFFERRLNKFNATILDGNIASVTLVQKLGCVREGVRRQNVYANGRYRDELLYGLTADEFRAKFPPTDMI